MTSPSRVQWVPELFLCQTNSPHWWVLVVVATPVRPLQQSDLHTKFTHEVYGGRGSHGDDWAAKSCHQIKLHHHTHAHASSCHLQSAFLLSTVLSAVSKEGLSINTHTDKHIYGEERSAGERSHLDVFLQLDFMLPWQLFMLSLELSDQ